MFPQSLGHFSHSPTYTGDEEWTAPSALMVTSYHGANKPTALKISSFLKLSLPQRYILKAPVFQPGPWARGFLKATLAGRVRNKKTIIVSIFSMPDLQVTHFHEENTHTFFYFPFSIKIFFEVFFAAPDVLCQTEFYQVLSFPLLTSGWTDIMAVFPSDYTSLLPSSRSFIIFRLHLANSFLFHNASIFLGILHSWASRRWSWNINQLPWAPLLSRILSQNILPSKFLKRPKSALQNYRFVILLCPLGFL